MMRLVQPGSGDPRTLFIFYLVGQHLDAELRRVLGPGPCIVAYVQGKPTQSLDDAVAQARGLARFERLGRLCLVGYSLGCSGVRARLLEGSKSLDALAALLLVDGTHASKPPATWQIDVWQKQFDRARRGEILAIATHTLQTYVEHLSGQETPFLATVTVLRKATGFPLDAAGPVDAPVEVADGKLRVCSYQSKSIDAQAHILQQRKALPDLLARYVRPHLDELDGKKPGPTALAASDVPVLFGAEALDVAERSRATSAPTRPPLQHLLRLGSSGPEVVTWQNIVGVDPDGIFGPETQAVTKRWQRDHGLTDDGIVGPLTWNMAMGAGEAPKTGEVPKVATSLGEEELASVLEQGHHLALDASPSRNRLACAWAQVALENGRGGAVWNNNLGNITAFGSWPGAYYVIRVAERVSRNPDVWKEIDMRFRAHADAIAGAADYWKVISKRYAAVLPFFDAGDAEGAAFELSRLGYYTAHADRYARAMRSLYQEFLRRDLGG
ncbi:peptidoglycan-binding protein [Polyangium sp. y55x31]|uniref:peptidoglycan-binding protein n=1 Tax=Polyangium sp. y55x31 TaxID=3042688 RepID=UPI002482FF4C|nr:peptidoglycan-binding protein [Polyangium sp. y55x31]MDI1478913.1 peptidoglycan-binding protein [Polyangium sp. y55x31]